MSTQAALTSDTTGRPRPWRARITAGLRFARHYLEMVAAMLVGMVVLGWLESLLASAIGHPRALDGATVSALLMAANMSVAVAAWMSVRRHRLPLIGEMVAGMSVGFVALVPLWMGGTGHHHAATMAGHEWMYLGMLVAMLGRRQYYSDEQGNTHG
ncbi:hypothetical protein [Cryptosporangium minutisporangium]|uniref:SPW repeat-containing protein n=1 Tax=Cryptosporangium minutisporangium TaxID=113569 RepID=A0ABP6STL0_9ACTN